MESKINELYEINEQQNAHITSLKEENRILETTQAQQQTAREGWKMWFFEERDYFEKCDFDEKWEKAQNRPFSQFQ